MRPTDRVLLCTVGDFVVSLHAAQVLALRSVEGLEVTAPSEPWLGTIRLGEQVFPVLDLARRLGLPPQEDWHRGQLLLLTTAQGAFALRVERGELLPADEDRTLQPLPSWLRSPATALFAGLESPASEPAAAQATGGANPDRLGELDILASDTADEADSTLDLFVESAGPLPLSPLPLPSLPQSALPRLRIDAARLIADDSDWRASGPVGHGLTNNMAALAACAASQAERFLSVSLPASKLPSIARFGVPLVQVLEVLAPLPVIPVPLTPPALCGVAWWRGQPVAVLDLNVWLRRPASSVADRGRWVIFRPTADTEPVAVRVRSDVRVERPPFVYAPCDPPPALATLPLRGSFQHDNKFLVFPDWGRLEACFSSET